MSDAVLVHSRQRWARLILSEWRKSVEAILETGRLLFQAKETLPHGEFRAMVREDLRWSPRMAQMLMAVAQHPVLSKANHGALLPASWRTLYALPRLHEPVLV